DEDLLLQMPFRGNCGNWVLGHIVSSRNSILGFVGEDKLWGDEERALYSFDSEPITGAECPHFALEKLIADLDAAGECLIAKLESMDDSDLDENLDEKTILGDRVRFMVWHESYHTGQFEYIRQLAGKDDKVI
ncbi:MAG: DinB family protein, partial [Aggregatilineales bacterium]